MLAVGMLAQGSFSAIHLGLPALAPFLADRFDLGLVALGALISAPAMGTLAALLAWGVLADRVGERRVLVAGVGGAAVFLVAGALASPSALALGCWLALAGLSGSAANAATGRAVAEWFAPDERGLAMGLRHTSTPIAGAIAALTLPALAEHRGLPAALIGLALGAALAAAAAGVWLTGRAPSREIPEASSAPRPFRDRRVWGLSLAASSTTLAQLGVIAFMVVYLSEVRGWSLPAAAGALALAQLLGAAARPFAGLWSDRAATRLVPLRLLAAATAVSLVALAASGALPSGVAAALMVIAATAAMSGNGISFAAVAEAAGFSRAGTALGIQNTVVFVAVVVAPPLFGGLVVLVGWSAAFGLLALAPLAGAIAYGALWRAL